MALIYGSLSVWLLDLCRSHRFKRWEVYSAQYRMIRKKRRKCYVIVKLGKFSKRLTFDLLYIADGSA